MLCRMAGKQLILAIGVLILYTTTFYLFGLVDAQQLNRRTFKKTFVENSKKCTKEVGAPSATAVTYLTSPERTDRNSKCFTSCLLNKFNLMDKQGKYNPASMQTFLNSIPESRFKTSVKGNLAACMQENSKDPCDKGYKFVQCFYRRAQ